MKKLKYNLHRRIIGCNRNRRLRMYEHKLAGMSQSQKSHPEMIQWLEQQDEECSIARLNEFFRHGEHLRRIENQWYELNASKERSATLQEFLKTNPPPDLATVITLLRFSIFQLATSGAFTNASIKLMDKLTRTLLKHELAFKKLELDSGKKEKVTPEEPDFDNTEKIAAMRKAAFREAEELLASGRIVIPD